MKKSFETGPLNKKEGNNIENHQETLEELLENLLLQKSEKINSGKNGYIFEVELNIEVFDALFKVLKEEGLVDEEGFNEYKNNNLNEPSVAKLLKFTSQVSAQKEVHMQKVAKDILDTHYLSDDVYIPDALELKDHHLHLSEEETKELAHKHHCQIKSEVEYILMDKVDGVDLATFAYRETLVEGFKEEKSGGIEESILKNEVIRNILDYKLSNPPIASGDDENLVNRFYKAGGEVRRQLASSPEDLVSFIDSFPNIDFRDQFIEFFEIEVDLDFIKSSSLSLEEYIRNINNSDILSSLISNKYDLPTRPSREKDKKMLMIIKNMLGYKGKLPKHLLRKLEDAIKTLHDHGVYHRDLHERNIMIDKDGRLALIDFATATTGELGSDQRIYSRGLGEGQKYYEDHQSFSPESLLAILTSDSSDKKDASEITRKF